MRIKFWAWLLVLITSNTGAITIQVDGSCTLAAAITAANTDQISGGCVAGDGSDVIHVVEANQTMLVSEGLFQSGLQSNMTVALPTVTSELVIEGNGLHIQADTSVNQFRVMDMIGALGERLTLRNLTISGADDGAGTGSALFTLGGRLTIENSQFRDNHGAILMIETADVVLDGLLVENNWMHEAGTNSPGIEANGTEFILRDSSLINNQVIIEGGGFVMSEGHAAGGLGITSPGTAFSQVINTTISGNSAITGGGLSVRNQSNSTASLGNLVFLRIINSTIADNDAWFGGGMVVFAVNSSASLEQTLIVGNRAQQVLGRELWVEDGANLTMDGFNVVQQHEQNSGLMAVLGVSDLISPQITGALIQPLTTINGMKVHPLPVGSDAIDAGASHCDTPQDQLGQPRPGGQTSFCDVGAVEFVELIFKNGFNGL